MDKYLNYLKSGLSQGLSAVSPAYNIGKSVYDYATKSPQTASVASPAPVQPKPQVTPTKAPVTSNPSAVTPAVKSPAAKAYIASQSTTPKVTIPQGGTPTITQTQPTIPTPTAPTQAPQQTQPSAMDNYIAAYKKYLDTQTQNQDVANAKRAYNDYVAEQSKAISGREGRGLGIPLEIVRGEQERLLKQSQPEAERLQNEIQIAQDAQTGAQTTAKNTLDFFKTIADSQKEADKPIIVDGVAYEKQADGSLKPLTTKQLTPSEQYGSGSIGEYNFAVANGYKGSYSQYQNEDANRKIAIARAGVGSTGLSTQQFNALNQITTRFQADPIINQALKGATASAIADQVIANPNSATNQLKSLYILVKNLDPDSAVREGELSLANQTQSYLQQFSNTLARIDKGQVIAPDAAVALAQATKELMSAWNATAAKREQQYNSQAGTLGVGNEFGSYIQGSDLGYKNTSTPPQANQFADIESKLEVDPSTKTAYLPRAVWASLGNRMDALLQDVANDGYTLKIKD